MASFMSVANSKACQRDCNEVSTNEIHKRQSMSSSFDEESPRLIPNLPDELSLQIIARLPRICYFNVRLVSRKWKETIMSAELYKVRKELGTAEEWLYLLLRIGRNKPWWHALDPRSQRWQRLPTMPNVVYEEESKEGSSNLNMVEDIRSAEVISGLLGQKKDASDEMSSFAGSAIGAVDGCLYVLGGCSKASRTMRSVLRFDPIQNMWSKVTSMSTSRAYCKIGILNNKLYVVGGINRSQAETESIFLQSAEVFDPSTDTWSHVPSMPFSKAQVLLTAFPAELKPLVPGLASYMGRLCVTQRLLSNYRVIDVGGEIYDPETNSWIEMPKGMRWCWLPLGTRRKLSVVVDDLLYAYFLDSLDSGRIMVYDQGKDSWKVVVGKFPLYDSLSSHPPFLLAGFHGKLHVIAKDVNHNMTILQVDPHNNLDSSPSNSTPLSPKPLHEFPELASESDAVVWKVFASRGFGLQAQLVGCEVINI